MATTFLATLKSLIRNRALLFWPLAFPIIMATMFGAMFANLQSGYAFDPFQLGVVRDANYDAAPGLDDLLDELSSPSADTQYVAITTCDDAADAEARVNSSEIEGYLTVDADGTPQMHLSRGSQGDDTATVMSSILDSYVRTVAELKAVAAEKPELLASPSVAQATIAAFQTDAVSTTRLKLTRTDPDPSARYFYALLAMTVGMVAMIGAFAVQRTQANTSPVGARASIAGVSRWKVLVATVLASWLCGFACLVVAFAYMRVVVKVDFGGRDGLCLVALAVSSLFAMAAGALVGTTPGVKTGIFSAIACVLSIFTGLYGSASQRLADDVAANLPILSRLNPLWQIAHSFFSLLYYDSLEPFAQSCGTLLAMTAALVAVAALRMRRQRYEHL